MFRSPPGLDRHRLSEERAKAGCGLVLAGFLLLPRFLSLSLRLPGGRPTGPPPRLLARPFRGRTRRKGQRLGLRLREQELHAFLRGESGLDREGNRPAERDRQQGPDGPRRRVARSNRETERVSSREGEVYPKLRVVHGEDVAAEHHPPLVHAPEVEPDNEREDLQ